MAKQTHLLSDIKAKALKTKGLHNDGAGLYLKVTDAGTKSWIFRYKIGGRSRDMGLGTYPAIKLAAAREMAGEAYAKVKSGVDPIEERKQLTAPPPKPKRVVTFDEAAERYIGAHEKSWKNDKHRQQWRNTLTTYADPVIGRKDVAAIKLDDVLQVLEPIWTDKAETASRVRGRIESVLDWAAVRGLRTGENPARWRGHLKHLLPARNKKRTVRHHPALPWRELPAFMAELRANNSIPARALEFTILTAARTSETTDVTWPEIDKDGAAWIVPAERMKAGVLHRVPLTAAALAVLDGLPRIEGDAHVFAGARKGRPLSNMAMLELLRGMRPGLTVHGFRSTFRDWAAEGTNFPRELAESALAHVVGNEVERAYQRGDLFDKRRKLMQAWAEFCGRGAMASNVLPMRARG
jgi:integrase